MPPRLLPIPHLPQRYDTDCPAACAAMVLSAAGYAVAYDRLMATLQVADWGAPFNRLSRLSQLFAGLNITIAQGHPGNLRGSLATGVAPILSVYTAELPYWNKAAYHAVVLVGESDGSCYLNDPAFPNAPQIVTWGDLDLAWLETDTTYALLRRAR